MRKYPSQEDAQLLIDIMNDKGVYSGACSPEFRKLGEAYTAKPVGWSVLYDKTFGEKSPWTYMINKKNQYVLKWDKEKSEKLGLTNY